VGTIVAVPDFEDYRAELHRHCTRLCGADAEDALQDTLLRAWRSRRRVVSDCPRAWLYRIATNACLDVLARRETTLVPLDGFDVAVPPEQLPESIVFARETIELVVAEARHLSPRQRAAFALHDVLGRSAAESALAQSISVAASNSAVQRARRILRAQLRSFPLEDLGVEPAIAEGPAGVEALG
jgi:RNA polymerase sigma-70 factor (ECF subfamily)